MDPQINSINVKESVIWDANSGHSFQYTVMTYKVGVHGPFTYKVPTASFNQASAEAAMNQTAATLRGIKALPA